ncbi:MAG TPA: histidine phosphatase family protein [Vicinamibacterales bacterium]|jgi:phosphohistidine phosphatase
MIYLVHHGDAVGPDIDPQRPLSSAGRAAVERLATRAAERGVKPVAIHHSGKLRARQTANAFLRLCNPLAEFSAIRGLQPEDPAIWIRETLAHEDREVMLVGHMPNLPRLLTLLVTGREAPLLEFPLHGLVAIEIARGAAGEHYEERWRLVL